MLDWAEISIYQWVGFSFGILYVLFAAYNKNQCWIYSAISTLAIAFEDFINLQLYFDGVIQIFYALIAICGLYVWLSGGNNNATLRISKLSLTKNIGYIVLVILIALPTGYIMDMNSDAAFPYLDGFTSILSILATCLMVYKILDTWAYWIIIDIGCMYLYFERGAPLICLLYGVYAVLAIIGWKNWISLYRDKSRRAFTAKI